MVLCGCLRKGSAPGDQASHEKRKRVQLLRVMVANLDELRQRLENDWNAFAKELHHRILPVMRARKDGNDDVCVLHSSADAIKEQMLTWPGKKGQVLKQMAEHAARIAAELVLPKGWKEKQELLNLFQLLYEKLEREGEEPTKIKRSGSSDGKQRKCCFVIQQSTSYIPASGQYIERFERARQTYAFNALSLQNSFVEGNVGRQTFQTTINSRRRNCLVISCI